MAKIKAIGIKMTIPNGWQEGPANLMIKAFEDEVKRLKRAMYDLHPDVGFVHIEEFHNA